MSQSQKISYSSVDDATGKETVGIEIRRGLLKEERVLKNEKELLPMLVKFLEKEQSS